MSSEALREQADALEGMAEELRQIADQIDRSDNITLHDLDALRKDYSPDLSALTREIVTEFPQLQHEELRVLGQFDHPDYIFHIRDDNNFAKVIEDARFMLRDRPGLLVALEFSTGARFKFVPKEG